MVNLNGIELKGVKYFPDHEGAPCPYGNIYFGGKKVGNFRYDSWGGPTDISFTEPKQEHLCRAVLASAFLPLTLRDGKNGEQPLMEDILEDFINFSLELSDYEKHLKKITKKYERGFGILVPYEYIEGGLDYKGEKMMHFYYQMKDGCVVDLGDKQQQQITSLKEKHPADLFLFLTLDNLIKV